MDNNFYKKYYNYFNMKHLIYFLIGITLLTSCNTPNRFEIKGTIENGKGKQLTFSELLVNGTSKIKDVKINDKGSFVIKHETNIPRFYHLAISEKNFLTLLIEPGEKVSINAMASDLSQAQIIGSEGTVHVQKLSNQLAYTKERLDSIQNYIDSFEDQNRLNEEMEEINQKYAEIVDEQRDSSIKFIVSNLNSLASIVALYQKYDDENYVLYKNRDIQYIKIVSEALQKEYPESQHVKALIADKDNLLKRYEQLKVNQKLSELAESQATVYNVPEIYLPNQSGDSISLNEVNAKYILLSFWASWNEESMNRNVELLDLYKKYHIKGFEIYQVSLDTKIENWMRAINFDQLPWINVIDTNGRTSYYAKLYNVKTLPTSYLINPEGEIVSINPSKALLESTFQYNLK